MVRRSARLIKQGGEPKAKDADTNGMETTKPPQALDEANAATSTDTSNGKQNLNDSKDTATVAAVTKEENTSLLNSDQSTPHSPKPQRQKRKYVRQKRLSTANDEPVAPANGSSNKDFAKLAKPSQHHKIAVPKKMMKEPVVKPRIGKMTTTIHKTADQRKIIKVFKRKSLFPEVKQFKEHKVFKKPRHTDLTMEEQYMQDDLIDECKYEDIIKDIESLTNIHKDNCLMECMKTLKRVVVPHESEYHSLLSNNDKGLSTNKDSLELSPAFDGVNESANDVVFHGNTPELKIFEEEQDQVLYDLLTKDDNNLNDENIVTTIASLNNIDISHINTLLINRSVPRSSKIATRETYTNDEIRKDHDSLSQKMNVKRRKK
ncbi:hypothetical protein ACO0QE_002532 [Hanseniaspora vineae]